MKEVLLTDACSKTGTIDQKAILYLNKCFCGLKFCMERAAPRVQSCLKRIKLEDCATEVSIKYQQEATQAAQCLVGHIHLDKEQLNRMEITMENILQTYQKNINKHVTKSRQLMQIFEMISSEHCLCDERALQVSCLQCFIPASTTTGLSESNVIQMMTNTIFPILLDTIIKGDPRVQEAKLIWVEPELTCWVQNSSAEQHGELALEITVEKIEAEENGGTWGIVMDACVPVMDLIGTTRSAPCNIQEVQKVFGISCVFDRVAQHLSKAVGIVTKSVLTEHLITVASSMTCTGSLHGFNRSGYKATFQSLKVQAPFTKATLSRPMQCFRKSAEKVDSDQLASVVSTCSWGNHAAVGTGSAFKIHWNHEKQSASNEILREYSLYDFLEAIGTIGATEQKTDVPHSLCLYDVDQLPEDEVQEDEVVCLGGTRPISWTDKPKGDSLLHDFMGRAGMRSTVQEHQGMQKKKKWNSVPNWRNNKPMGPPTDFAQSTSTRGQNNRRFTGQVYVRKQPKHRWSQAATHQDNKLSWCRENVAGAQNFANAESYSSSGWNRKNSSFGRGGHRGGGRGMWNQRNHTVEAVTTGNGEPKVATVLDKEGTVVSHQ